MIISFSGEAGSGKSTIAKMLAEKLNWPRYYIGGLRRQKAALRGLTLDEYNKLGETDPATDKEVDEYQTKLGQTKDNFIIEGRTSWHFIPHSFKIFLNVNEKIGAKRIFNELKGKDGRNEARRLNTIDDVIKSLKERKKSDILRYKKYFNINAYDKKNYDLVIDTSKKTAAQVFDEIYALIAKKLKATK